MSYKLTRDKNKTQIIHVGQIYYCVGSDSEELANCADKYKFRLYWVYKTIPYLVTGASPAEQYYVKSKDFKRVEKEQQQEQMNTPTKGQVMEAANTSPEAKAALAKLFPDYFKRVSSEDIYTHNKLVRLSYLLLDDMGGSTESTCFDFLSIVNSGEYEGRGFRLSYERDYRLIYDTVNYQRFKIITDDDGGQILVPITE